MGHDKKEEEEIFFGYINYRYEYSIRKVIPLSIDLTSSAYHPEKQWIMKAWDINKKDYRSFALSDCNFQIGKELNHGH